MSGDLRGWRIALVPETLVNPPPTLRGHIPDVMGLLEANGYGVLQLPPTGEHSLLLAVIADQVAEYAHHGYAVVGIGLRSEAGSGLHWRRLAPLLKNRGVAIQPPRHILRSDVDAAAESRRLHTFLADYDLPQDEQKRWRDQRPN